EPALLRQLALHAHALLELLVGRDDAVFDDLAERILPRLEAGLLQLVLIELALAKAEGDALTRGARDVLGGQPVVPMPRGIDEQVAAVRLLHSAERLALGREGGD